MTFVTLCLVQHFMAKLGLVSNILHLKYHQWFLLDDLRAPLVQTCRFDKGLEDEVQAEINADESATVLRPDAVELEKIIKQSLVSHRDV